MTTLTDNELADAVVALDIGVEEHIENYSMPAPGVGLYTIKGDEEAYNAKMIVRDPRVAMALAVRCKFVGWSRTTTGGSYVHARAIKNGYGEQPAGDGNENRAIIQACIEAHTNNKD